MRIISGTFRSRLLKMPPASITRPTSDRARQAIFNMMTHHAGSFQDTRVADVCAGTGAFGFEALSRGAREVTFVENNIHAARVILENAKSLGVLDRVTLKHTNAQSPAPSTTPFDVLFFDPPYEAIRNNSMVIMNILSLYLKAGWIGPHSVIVWEHPAETSCVIEAPFEEMTHATYGAIGVRLIHCAQDYLF